MDCELLWKSKGVVTEEEELSKRFITFLCRGRVLVFNAFKFKRLTLLTSAGELVYYIGTQHLSVFLVTTILKGLICCYKCNISIFILLKFASFVMCTQTSWRKAAWSTLGSCRRKWRQWLRSTGLPSTATSCSSTSAHCPQRLQMRIQSDENCADSTLNFRIIDGLSWSNWPFTFPFRLSFLFCTVIVRTLFHWFI